MDSVQEHNNPDDNNDSTQNTLMLQKAMFQWNNENKRSLYVIIMDKESQIIGKIDIVTLITRCKNLNTSYDAINELLRSQLVIPYPYGVVARWLECVKENEKYTHSQVVINLMKYVGMEWNEKHEDKYINLYDENGEFVSAQSANTLALHYEFFSPFLTWHETKDVHLCHPREVINAITSFTPSSTITPDIADFYGDRHGILYAHMNPLLITTMRRHIIRGNARRRMMLLAPVVVVNENDFKSLLHHNGDSYVGVHHFISDEEEKIDIDNPYYCGLYSLVDNMDYGILYELIEKHGDDANIHESEKQLIKLVCRLFTGKNISEMEMYEVLYMKYNIPLPKGVPLFSYFIPLLTNRISAEQHEILEDIGMLYYITKKTKYTFRYFQGKVIESSVRVIDRYEKSELRKHLEGTIGKKLTSVLMEALNRVKWFLDHKDNTR